MKYTFILAPQNRLIKRIHNVQLIISYFRQKCKLVRCIFIKFITYNKGAVAPATLRLRIRTLSKKNTIHHKTSYLSAHTPKPSSKRELVGVLFCWFLCCFQFKKGYSESVFRFLCKKLLYVVCKSEQKKLGLDVVFTPAQKSSEAVILFQHSEHAFRLYTSVHSELFPEFRGDVFLTFGSQFPEFM